MKEFIYITQPKTGTYLINPYLTKITNKEMSYNNLLKNSNIENNFSKFKKIIEKEIPLY